MINLHQAGVRGHLGKYLKNFLQNQKIGVRIGNTVSDLQIVHNGVPQGSVLRVSLFSLAINEISNIIPFPVTFRLFADDLCVSLEACSSVRVQRILQKTVNNLEAYASMNGLKFSSVKTHITVFHKKRNNEIKIPRVVLNGNTLTHKSEVKFLGLLFDQKLTWQSHIKNLKNICTKALNILKCLNNPNYGCNRNVLFNIYRALIRPKLDYGSVFYNQASESVLSMLDPVHHAGIRLCTGALRTSPKFSLYSESGEPPLQICRLQLTGNFACTLAACPDNPVFHYIFGELPKGSNSKNHIYCKLKYELPNLPDLLSLNKVWPDSPPWSYKIPDINFELCHFSKSSVPKSIIRLHLAVSLDKYKNFTMCFTDGSKMGENTGCAYSIGGEVKRIKLTEINSVYTAELVAIFKCLEQISESSTKAQFLILSDSLSALTALRDVFSTNPLVQRIHILYNYIHNSTELTVKYHWIPSHIGITGNERVDAAAKKASKSPDPGVEMFITSDDNKTAVKKLVTFKWDQMWNTGLNNKLKSVKECNKPWISSTRKSHKEEVVLTRLRIGHSRLTHSYLFRREQQPMCIFCNQEVLSVQHIIVECTATRDCRIQYGVPSDLKTALGDDDENIDRVFRYLKELNVFHLI